MPRWNAVSALRWGIPGSHRCARIRFKRVRGRLYVSCHITIRDDMPLARVHDVQTALEIRFKQDAPELFRVLIHPEPQTDNRR